MAKPKVKKVNIGDDDFEKAVQAIVSKKEKKKTKVESAIDALTNALEERFAAESDIKRTGKEIIVPAFMDLEDAADAIISYQTQMEEETEQILEFIGHEYELLAACNLGIKDCFGQFFATSKMVQTFFGAMKVSAKNHTIPIGPNETMVVPYGRVVVPGLKIEMDIGIKLNKTNRMESTLGLFTRYRKKFDPLITIMKESIDSELKKNSVFKGKAIDSEFNFIDLQSFPTDKIVYSDKSQKQLDVHIFGPVENCADLEDKNLNVRRSVLLHGPFGTGKTLTALMAAKCCIKNEWTFMNVLPGDDISQAVHFAERYQPALVFFEDIDQVTPRGRTASVNSILNVVDGFLSKRSKVMIVMTTNHTEKIERAMMRPGRIDAVLSMGDVDETVIEKMVKAYCPDMTSDIDPKRLLESAEGYTPSFISEACQRSVLYAIRRSKKDGSNPHITTGDIELSLIGLKPQFDLMMEKDKEKVPELEQVFSNISKGPVEILNREVNEKFKSVFKSLQDIRDNL